MPIYEYRCPNCGYEQEAFFSVSDSQSVVHCTNCSSTTDKTISRTFGKPQVVDYYSEAAGMHFTGPAQKARELKAAGLSEAPPLKDMDHTASPGKYPVEESIRRLKNAPRT